MQTEALWAVTGASGYLGSHVVEQLLRRGEHILAIDNGSTGNEKYLEEHTLNPNFERSYLDIRDQASLHNLFTKKRPKFVIHLAALHFIPSCCKDPATTVSINVHGTQSVLSASRDANVNTLWFASTGDVYAPLETPLNELTTPISPFNIYGLSKSICEQLIALESRERPSAKFFIGRLFNLYGPRETNPHFLPEVIKQIVENPKSPLRLGSLWPKRDMVPVADAARAVIETSLVAPVGCTTTNIATGSAISMQDILDIVGDLLGTKLDIETDPAKVRAVERKHLQADVRQLKNLIGWTPHTDVRSALQELISKETMACRL